MRYLVVLDARSVMGRIYANGNNDGFVNDGEMRHPAIDCIEVKTDSPYYLYVKRDMSAQGGSQTIYVPHGAVVSITCYADDGPKPFGFAPSK